MAHADALLGHGVQPKATCARCCNEFVRVAASGPVPICPTCRRRQQSDTLTCSHWFPVNKFDQRAVGLYLRHYSARRYADGRARRQFAPPGETMLLLTPECDALFGWVRNRVERYDHQEGVCCFVFRNEGGTLSSELIAEADDLAWDRWPNERHWTYVWDEKVASVNPGYCFKQAGWRTCGRNKDGRLTILERLRDGR